MSVWKFNQEKKGLKESNIWVLLTVPNKLYTTLMMKLLGLKTMYKSIFQIYLKPSKIRYFFLFKRLSEKLVFGDCDFLWKRVNA